MVADLRRAPTRRVVDDVRATRPPTSRPRRRLVSSLPSISARARHCRPDWTSRCAQARSHRTFDATASIAPPISRAGEALSAHDAGFLFSLGSRFIGIGPSRAPTLLLKARPRSRGSPRGLQSPKRIKACGRDAARRRALQLAKIGLAIESEICIRSRQRNSPERCRVRQHHRYSAYR